jgi:NDP-sugar pyrophosphorylase family protein
MSLPVAILAGGLATRLRPLTERVPKILLDINGRPFAEYQIELLRRAGITRVVYCLGYLGEQVADALGSGARWQMTFSYVFDGPRPLGTGGAIRCALPQLGSAFFVMYGDSYLECDFGSIERAFRASGKSGLMTVFKNDNQWDRSNVTFDRGHIVRYDKTGSDPAMRHIDYGLAVLTPEAFDGVAQADFSTSADSAESGPAAELLDLATVYQRLIERDELAGYEVSDRFYEIGSLEGLEDLRAKLESQTRTAS